MEEQAVELVKTLAAMQQEGTLCDVTLQAEQKTIQAHKVILAAKSQYFMAMFNGNFRETECKVVTFQEVTYAGLSAIIDHIYSKDIEITAEMIPSILPAAHLFQMEHIIHKVTRLMVYNISRSTCFQYRDIAQKYQLDKVIKQIHEFILVHFKELCVSEDFFNASQKEFCGYLSSDTLRTELQEIDVYNTAKKWLEINQIQDSKTVTEVMTNVRFASINPEKLVEIIHDNIFLTNTECHNLIEEATKYQSNVYTQPFYEGKLNTKPRGIPGLVMFPSCSPQFEKHNIQFRPVPMQYLVTYKIFPVSDVIPEYSSINIVNVNNFLFVFGVGVESNEYQNFTKRYDASTDTWQDLSPIPRHPMLGVTTAHIGENIFLIAGLAMDIGEYENQEATSISDTYKYSIRSDTWTKCEDLPGKYYDCAATHLNGNIYCNGGNVKNYMKSNKHYAFDTVEEKWSVKTSMQYQRSCHVLEVLDDKLYAISGTSEYIDKSIEVYDTLTDQWTLLSCQPLHVLDEDSLYDSEHHLYRSCSTSYMRDAKIYLVGAYSSGNIVRFHIKKNYAGLSVGLLEETSYESPGPYYSSEESRTVACAFMTLPKLLANNTL